MASALPWRAETEAGCPSSTTTDAMGEAPGLHKAELLGVALAAGQI